LAAPIATNPLAANQAAGEVPSVISRSSGNDAAKVSGLIDVPTAKAALSGITSTLTVAPNTEVVYLFTDLPYQVQAEACAQKANEKNTKGLFHNDTLYF